MRKLFAEYTYRVNDVTDFKNYMLPTTATSASDEAAMTGNQYFQKFDNYFTVTSDGINRAGVQFDLTAKIIHGDFLKVSTEIEYISGEKPLIIYEEWNTTTTTVVQRVVKGDMSGFELTELQTYITNRFGNKQGRIFIGLEKGAIGKFRMRFPTARHFAQKEYTPELIQSKTKMFQMTKANGSWTVDTANSSRKLDPATLSFGGVTMNIHFTKPFIVDIPQVFYMSNKTLAGWTVHFGYRGKDVIELNLFDAAGTQVAWSTLPDGALLNVMAIAGNNY